MKISVIMASYNSETTIGVAIESFLSQDYRDKELIVIDGASTDGTLSVVASFSSPIIKYQSEADRGIYDAMNKGLLQVTGAGFGFLNSDDRYARSDSLTKIAAGLEYFDIVSGRLNFVREHDGSSPVRVWSPDKFIPGSFSWGYSLPHPSTYARRRVLDRVGNFSVLYRSAGDYDWLVRALELEGFSHGVIADTLVDMRLGGESTGSISAILQNSLETLYVRRKNLGSGFIDCALFLNIWKKALQTILR